MKSAAAIIETPPPPQAPPPAPPSQAPVLKANRLTEVGISWNCWQGTLEPGQRIEDALAPSFWKLHAHKLSLGDEITLRTADLRERALVLVVEYHRAAGHARVEILAHMKGAGTSFSESAREDFVVEHSGDIQVGYLVKRKGGAVVRDKFSSVEEARRFINSDLAPRIIGRDS